MKRAFLFTALTLSPPAWAQATYLGASASVANDFFGATPLFGVQAGSALSERATFRGGLETNLSDFVLSVDVLYAFYEQVAFLGYVGGGAGTATSSTGRWEPSGMAFGSTARSASSIGPAPSVTSWRFSNRWR